MKKAITLAETAMALVVVAIVISGALSLFLLNTNKRNQTSYMRDFHEMVASAPKYTKYDVSPAEKIVTKTTAYGSSMALFNSNIYFDVITGSVPYELCKHLLDEYVHQYRISRILFSPQPNTAHADKINITDSAMCNHDFNSIQFIYWK